MKKFIATWGYGIPDCSKTFLSGSQQSQIGERLVKIQPLIKNPAACQMRPIGKLLNSASFYSLLIKLFLMESLKRNAIFVLSYAFFVSPSLCSYVSNPLHLFGTEILTYNFYSLLHLKDAVIKFGYLDNFSSFKGNIFKGGILLK